MNTVKDVLFTTSLGNLFQSLTTLTLKNLPQQQPEPPSPSPNLPVLKAPTYPRVKEIPQQERAFEETRGCHDSRMCFGSSFVCHYMVTGIVRANPGWTEDAALISLLNLGNCQTGKQRGCSPCPWSRTFPSPALESYFRRSSLSIYNAKISLKRAASSFCARVVKASTAWVAHPEPEGSH